MSKTADDLLARLAGITVPGGCGTCAAEQHLGQMSGTRSVWRLEIRHEDDCPTYRAMRRDAA